MEKRLNIESVPAVCFPTASSLACSFDRDLAYKVGKALGEECLQEGVSVLLGPGANQKRSPLCGRNFEYFSEDPMLSGVYCSENEMLLTKILRESVRISHSLILRILHHLITN